MLYAVMAELRFKEKAKRDAVYDAIKARVPDLVLSRLSKHDCTHDQEPFEPCVNEEVINV